MGHWKESSITYRRKNRNTSNSDEAAYHFQCIGLKHTLTLRIEASPLNMPVFFDNTMCHVIPMLNLLSSCIWCYIWDSLCHPLTSGDSAWNWYQQSLICTNMKGSTTQQLQHLQYVQYGDLALSKCFNNRTVPGLETWIWACKPMLCSQALNVIAVETTVYQSIERSFGFSIPLHSWSYQRLTRLSSHQTVQIETDGKCSNFGCWNLHCIQNAWWNHLLCKAGASHSLRNYFIRTSTPRPSAGAGTTCNARILWPGPMSGASKTRP